MPIKGLTDRQAAFPQIGILRKGAPKPDKGPGRDLTYFRFDTDDEAARAMMAQAYGDKPQHINCYLPFSTTEENFFTAKEEWAGGGLVHRCDGETCSIWQTKDGSYSHEPKPCPGACSPVGRLKIIVPELQRFAYVVALTTSVHDIITLQENLTAAEAMRGGDLRGVPFVLSRRPREISTPSGKGGKRARREKWLLSIEPSPAWVGLQLDQMRSRALGVGEGGSFINDSIDALSPGEVGLDDDTDDTGDWSHPYDLPGDWTPEFGEFVETAIGGGLAKSEEEIKQQLKAAGFSGYKPSDAIKLFDALIEAKDAGDPMPETAAIPPSEQKPLFPDEDASGNNYSE